MSLQLIQQYHARVEKLIQYGGSRNESSIRGAFQWLLESYAGGKGLVLVPELEIRVNGAFVRPDGTLKNAVRQDMGYWESKDERDNLDAEIALKLAKGYPDSNILFEDSREVVLIQNGQEVGRSSFGDSAILHALLSQFVAFEPPFVRTFREAVGRFQNDLPDLLDELRGVIEAQGQANAEFQRRRDRLLGLAQKAINPHLTPADIREMLIQHILTEDIFLNVFNEAQFHRENNIARELEHLSQSFFTGAVRRNALARIESYYAIIRAAAAGIADHHEKQKFLKVIYENFYKAYNPAGADRLGIVYTPGEIVRFMIEAADHLVYQHFGKLLGDKGVNILDPATGTGTFVTELIEYLPKGQLPHKYAQEIFCNEVALLPYYTANL
ncbi:MAG: N-6 DNA methylase, partial [Deinococcota bacterium]|nr:N-6 DNA methylase [Deinococcota bacterium]